MGEGSLGMVCADMASYLDAAGPRLVVNRVSLEDARASSSYDNDQYYPSIISTP